MTRNIRCIFNLVKVNLCGWKWLFYGSHDMPNKTQHIFFQMILIFWPFHVKCGWVEYVIIYMVWSENHFMAKSPWYKMTFSWWEEMRKSSSTAVIAEVRWRNDPQPLKLPTFECLVMSHMIHTTKLKWKWTIHHLNWLLNTPFYSPHIKI